jgi:lipid-binding SYLF domain-containing protein
VRSTPRPWLAAAMAALLLVPGAAIPAQEAQWDTVARATMVLDDIVAKNRKGLPPLILRHAYAVAIFPDIVKGGFILGARHGEGVVLLRRADDSWTYPIFVTLGGGSVGLQAGFQSTDLVMVFKNRRSLDSFLRSKGKFTVGINGSVALGGAGVHGEADTDTALKSDIVAFSRNRGLFAGASLAGASLAIDWRANAAFYGRLVSPTDIARAENLVIPEPAVALTELLTRKAALAPLPRAADTIIIDNGVQAHEIRPDLEDLPGEEDLARDPESGPEPIPAPESRRPRARPRGEIPDLEALPPLEDATEEPAAPRASASDDPAPRTRPASLLPEPPAEIP